MTHRKAATALVVMTLCGLSACGEEESSSPAATSTGAAPAATTTQPAPYDPAEATAVDETFDQSEVADAGHATIEVLKVADPQRGKDPFKPEAGNRFVGVTFKITSKITENYRAGAFVLYGEGDEEYMGTVPDPKGFSGASLGAGESKTAYLLFEVPKSEKSLRFHVNAPLRGDKNIEIRLDS